MKILFIDDVSRLAENYTYRYYGDLYRELCKVCEVETLAMIPNNIRDYVKKKNYDCVIFGLGYFAKRDSSAYGKIDNLAEVEVPTIGLLHKAQIMIKEKLMFFKLNNIKLLVDPHITYKKYGELLDIESTRIWFSATPDTFYDRQVEKIYDVGFSGASHGNGKIKGPTENLRDRVYDRLKDKNLNLFWNRQTSASHRISSMEEYATLMNKSKIWIATTGPIMDVSPRYFEVVLSKTLLFCNNMPYEYEGIFIDGETCVTYDNDLNNFDEKLEYYLNNEEERNKIIENSYNLFIENYTSYHMCQKLLHKIRELKNG